MDEVKKCRYCGDMPKQTTHEGRNRIGRLGFVSVMQCSGCLRRVETFCKNEPQGRVMTNYCPNCGAKMESEI